MYNELEQLNKWMTERPYFLMLKWEVIDNQEKATVSYDHMNQSNSFLSSFYVDMNGLVYTPVFL